MFPTEKDFSVTFEVNFQSVEDQQLSRIFLLELGDSKRQVMNAPGIQFNDKQFPEDVKKEFPNAMKTRSSNGSITFKVGEFHLKKGID